jgi:pyruvate/2-oxoglutarate dehydrogenase complex dihydrolipoamide acyltransferase (E2) component
MGDSISEGSISAVLKSAGDQVVENDVIAQIETDKVTIDVKAPSDGRIVGILVKEQDTVIPGQLIATVDDTAAAGMGAASPAPSATASSTPPPPAAPEPAADAHAPSRIPGILFPPRVTPDGQRISSLAAAEALKWIKDLMQPRAPATAAATATAAAQPPRPAAPAAAPESLASSNAKVTTWLDEQPRRRELTEEEMEVIMLGGASP